VSPGDGPAIGGGTTAVDGEGDGTGRAGDAGGAAGDVVGTAAEGNSGHEVHQSFVVARDQLHFIHLRRIDEAGGGGVLQVDMGLIGGDGNDFGARARNEAAVDGKGVLGVQDEPGDEIGLEAGVFYLDVIGAERQRVRSVEAGGVGGEGANDLSAVGVGQGDRGSFNDGAGGVGDGAADAAVGCSLGSGEGGHAEEHGQNQANSRKSIRFHSWTPKPCNVLRAVIAKKRANGLAVW